LSSRLFFALIVALAGCVFLNAQEAISDTGSFLAAYEFVSSVSARLEGSPSEKTVVAYIERFLDERNIPNETKDFGTLTAGHSYSVSIEALLPGRSRDELIVIAPLNSHTDTKLGVGDGLNIALALSLAATYAQKDHNLTLRVLFPGAEFGEDEKYPIGSQSFLSSYFPVGNSAVLYLDFAAPPDRIVVRTGDRGYVSPRWLLEDCLRSIEEANLSFLSRGNENQFYRLGVAVNPAPIGTYLANGYPAISFQSSAKDLATDSIDDWAASFLSVVDRLLQLSEVPAEWDRHYLTFQSRLLSLVVREETYIVILLVSVGLLVLYPVVLSRRFKSYAASLAMNFWALPMLLILVFLLLLLGTFLIEGLSLLKGYPDYWTTNPALFFLLKLMTATFLFSLMSRYLKRLPFPRRGRFYSAAALLVLTSDLFILGIMDLSLAYYVLWACVWAFFFSLAHSRTLKAIFLVLSPVWLVKAAYDMFTITAEEMARDMILARTSGNLLIAFVLFPFLLMLIRLDFMFRHPRKKTKRLLLTIIYITLGLGCGGVTGFLAIKQPFGTDNKQPVLIREVQDLTEDSSYIEIQSPASLGRFTLQTDTEPIVVETRDRTHTVEAQLRRQLLSTAIEVSRFLGRATYSVTISSEGLPSTLTVLLTSDTQIVIYDSSLPYSFADSKTVEVYVGKFPPNPLRIDLTVPGSLKGRIEVTAEHVDPPTKYILTGENLLVSQRLTVTAGMDLGEARPGRARPGEIDNAERDGYP
jgi:hypothetical protein